MKTTIENFIISITTLSVYFLLALLFALVFSSCQPEEVAPMQPLGRFPGPIEKVPPPNVLPPDEVVRTVNAGTTKWRITYNNVNYNFKQSYQQFFSTLDGSFYNKAQLNSSTEATARADMSFMFWYASSPDNNKYGHKLKYPDYASATRFKPAEFGTWQLAAMTVGNPAQFQSEFENSTFEPTRFQPYNYEENGDESAYLKAGDIFLFKTDRDPVRYGAVHIIAMANPFLGNEQTIVEVTVQADNSIVELGN